MDCTDVLPKKKRIGLIADIKKHKYVYMLALPVLIYYILFCYVPMYGAVIAFKNYSPILGIIKSPWAYNYGFEHFINFFSGSSLGRLLRNTFLISLYNIIFSFPAPILFALLLNDVRNNHFKKVTQTLTYLPHFISIMVVCGLIHTFTGKDGVINTIIAFFGGTRSNLLINPSAFRPIYIVSNIWQSLGWDSIIYLAALSNIDMELYEAAKIDGANHFKQIIHVTIPSIMPTVVIMFILKMGTLLSIGHEKIILLYNPVTYETADVISSYVYRQGIVEADYSFSTAVGLFQSIVNVISILITNKICQKLNETSLW